MLNSMRPPTDNLYKFAAIFGLVLIGFGLWLWNQQFNRHIDAQVRASESLYEAWIDVYDSEALRGLLDKQLQRVRDGEAIYGLSLEAAEIDGVTDQQIEAVRRFEFIGHASATEIQKVQVYRWPLAFLVALGIFLSIIGFVFWWRHVQRYEDMLIVQRTVQSTSNGRRRTARYRQ